MLSFDKYNIKSLRPIDILLLLLLFNYLKGYFFITLSRIPHLGIISYIAELTLIVTLILLSLPKFINELNIKDFMFFTTCLFIYLIHYLFFLNNQAYLDELFFEFIFFTLPYYFVGRIIDYKKLSNLITVLSIASIVCFSIIRFIINANEDHEWTGGDMHSAYIMLPYVIFTILNAFKTKKIISICFGIYSITLLISLGNRGSILYAIIYIAIMVLLTIRFSKRKIIFLIFLGFFALLLYIYYDLIFAGLYVFLESKGLSIRILDKINENEFYDSSGRDYLISTVLNHLVQNPIGLGIAGDRVILGVYVHNLFIEFLSIFGILGGLIVIILFLRLIYKTCKAIINVPEYIEFYTALICFGCLPLMTSSSFIEWPMFFLLIGYSVRILKMKKSLKISNKQAHMR